jgi:transposase
MKITHIGIDLAKQNFDLCGMDGRGRVVLRRRLRRAQVAPFLARQPACQIGLEACGSAHHWARTLSGLGHRVRLIAPRFVQPYRKDDKNDRSDAEAICEALTRPSMRFVAVKTAEQQAILTLHRARALLSEQRTALINQIRGLLAEFGLLIGQGAARVRRQLPEMLADAEAPLPPLAREVFADLHQRLIALEQQLADYDRRIAALANNLPKARRLMGLPGIGPITATALLASVGDIHQFRNARQFAAWLGLVPRHYASGGKTRYGRITKRGDRYLRTLLVHGARAAMRTLKHRRDALGQWAAQVQQRRGFNKATIALAARHARIIWCLLARDCKYQPRLAV